MMANSATRNPKEVKNNAKVLIQTERRKHCVATKKIIPYDAHNNALRQVTYQYAVRPLSSCTPTSAAKSTMGTNSVLRRTASLPHASWRTAHRATHTAAPTSRKSTRLNSSHLGISYAVFC